MSNIRTISSLSIFLVSIFAVTHVTANSLNSQTYSESKDKIFTATVWALEHSVPRIYIKEQANDSIYTHVPMTTTHSAANMRLLFSEPGPGQTTITIDPDSTTVVRNFPGIFKTRLWNKIRDGLKALR
jgi:hypothetical protein